MKKTMENSEVAGGAEKVTEKGETGGEKGGGARCGEGATGADRRWPVRSSGASQASESAAWGILSHEFPWPPTPRTVLRVGRCGPATSPRVRFF